MKKLMTMIAAVATAFGLYATQLDTGTSFEGTSAGALADNLRGITELTEPQEAADKDNYWDLSKITGSATATITKFNPGEAPEDSGRSGKFNPGVDNNLNYLALETTTNALTRYLAADKGVTKYDAETSNIFFDSFVKLSAFDGEPEIADDAKVAVWLFDKSELETGAEAVTNLMVTIDTGAGFESYNCGNYDGLVDTWARVTIKAMKVAEDQIGFVIYLNGNVTPVKDVAESITYPAGLTPAAGVYAAAFQLFPLNTKLGTTISSVSFAGKGAVDDIVFTDDAPEFAKDTEFQVITWTAAAVTEIMIDGKPVENTGRYEAPIVAEQPIVIAWTGTDAYINGSKTISTPSKDVEVDLTNDIKETKAVINGVKKDTVAAAVTEANKATEQAPALLKLVKATDEDDVALNNSYVLFDINGQTIGDLGDETEVENVVLSITNSNDAVDGIISGYLNYDVDVKAPGVKFDYNNNSTLIGEGLVTVTPPAGFELKPDTEDPHKYFVFTPVAAKGTVIFICDKLGAPVTNEQEVGTTVALPTPTDPTQIRTFKGWFAEEALETPVTAPVTVIDGEIKIYGKAEIEIVNNEIATSLDLQKLQAAVAEGNTFAGETLTQTADIDMSDAGIWYGIGPKNDLAHSFAGKYDGQNHRIYNITYAHVEYCGLFRGLNEGAELKNLTIESLGIAAKADGDDDRFGGGLFVGFAQGVTLENLTAKGALYGIWVANEKQGLGYNGGGIAMKVNGTSLVRNCTNEAEIVLSYTKAGGIVGFTQSISKNETTTFENCVNKGKIEILASGNNGVGGILGWANASVVMNNCASLGEIDIADGLTGTVVGSMIGQYDGGVCTVGAGNTTTLLDMVPSKGAVAIPGFDFATVANDVATFQPTLAKNTEYTQMKPITSDAAIFTLEAAGDTFILNTNGLAFAGTVVAKDETLVVTPEVKDTTITWTAAAAQTDPIPPVTPTDPTEVAAILEKLTDATALKAIITTPEQYAAFQTWAHSIAGKTSADVAASSLAAKSFEMSSVAEAHLFANEPKIEITETTVGDSWTATVTVLDGEQLVNAIKAIEDQVQVTTMIETANSWTKASATAEISKGIATITITKPGDTKGFMRVKAAK